MLCVEAIEAPIEQGVAWSAYANWPLNRDRLSREVAASGEGDAIRQECWERLDRE